ncbi:hypothetical protein QZH56_36730 [Streptomyces olivoreticuli]|uniref:hypothetical protein n=1 Tax=Streptomyces olivoreticuli TaxID=68246 RepID=UPI00265AF215|nr:hypothetical protein [Streptomyces olivoreticuli]WKK24124.1 hypothetical protein QZH56_36730 [Streptomyces olivoreticuli]
MRTRTFTAREFLAVQGIHTVTADRYTGAFTRAAKKLGVTAAAHAWRRTNHRYHKTAVFTVNQLAAYIPGGHTKRAKDDNARIWRMQLTGAALAVVTA